MAGGNLHHRTRDLGREGNSRHTVFPVANFFSVPMTFPLRRAAFRALFPLTTVSRGPPAPRLTFFPIRTVSSSMLGGVLCDFGWVLLRDAV